MTECSIGLDETNGTQCTIDERTEKSSFREGWAAPAVRLPHS